jgi:hypothetical protein
MAVTNNVDSNVQNQLIEEQIRQQQVQQNQPTETNNQTNGVATAVATAPAVQPEPLVPSTETAKVQELIVGGNAIKADLNDKVIIVASTGQTPPVDAPKGDSVIGKLTPPATLQNPESPDYNPDSLSNVGAKRANNTPFHELNMTADEVIQYAMQNGNSGQSGRVSDGIVEGIRNQNKDIGFISDVFQKLGAKGTAAVISETGYLGAGSYIDYPKGDGDPIIKDGKLQTYSPTDALESLRAAGKFNEGDMYQLAKTALETPTAYRDGKTQSELLNESITKERAGELDGNSTWAKKGLLGVTNYTTTGISNLDKAFQNASPELKAMWEKGLQSAIDDQLTAKSEKYASAGSVIGERPTLDDVLANKSEADQKTVLALNAFKSGPIEDPDSTIPTRRKSDQEVTGELLHRYKQNSNDFFDDAKRFSGDSAGGTGKALESYLNGNLPTILEKIKSDSGASESIKNFIKEGYFSSGGNFKQNDLSPSTFAGIVNKAFKYAIDGAIAGAPENRGQEFGTFLKTTIDGVNEASEANKKSKGFVQGVLKNLIGFVPLPSQIKDVVKDKLSELASEKLTSDDRQKNLKTLVNGLQEVVDAKLRTYNSDNSIEYKRLSNFNQAISNQVDLWNS